MSTNIPTIITPTDLQTAQGVHQQSATWLSTYEASHAKLTALATTPKLPAEVDGKLAKWQVSAKQAISTMKANREPFTQKAHEFVKAFTSQENSLQAMYDEIQALRNASVAAHRKEEAEKQAKERQDLARKTERVDLVANAESQLRTAYASILEGDKEELLQAFEAVDFDTLPTFEALLRDINPVLKYDRWCGINITLQPTQLNDQREIDAVKVQVIEAGDRFDKCAAHYKDEITRYAQHLLALLPHRRAALENPDKEDNSADDLRRKQEQLADDQRRQAAVAAEQAAEEAKKKMELQQRVEEANRQLEQPRAIESYAITVTTLDGWRAVIDFYLTNCETATASDLGKTKLDSMRLFAERKAKSTGELINHEGVSYEPKYKAVVKTARGKSKKEAA